MSRVGEENVCDLYARGVFRVKSRDRKARSSACVCGACCMLGEFSNKNHRLVEILRKRLTKAEIVALVIFSFFIFLFLFHFS